MTIKCRTTGFGLKRPGDGVAALFFEGDFGQIWDGAGELDRTARLPTSMTPQSTSIRGGGGWNAREMASRLRFYEGIFVDFFGRVGFKAQQF